MKMKTSIDRIDYSVKYEALINWWNNGKTLNQHLISSYNYQLDEMQYDLNKCKLILKSFNISPLDTIYEIHRVSQFIFILSTLVNTAEVLLVLMTDNSTFLNKTPRFQLIFLPLSDSSRKKYFKQFKVVDKIGNLLKIKN